MIVSCQWKHILIVKLKTLGNIYLYDLDVFSENYYISITLIFIILIIVLFFII